MVLGSGLLSSVEYRPAVQNHLYGYEVMLGLGLGGAIVSSILMLKLNASEEDAGRHSLLNIGGRVQSNFRMVT